MKRKILINGILEDLIDDFNTKFQSHEELMYGIEDATNRIVKINKDFEESKMIEKWIKPYFNKDGTFNINKFNEDYLKSLTIK